MNHQSRLKRANKDDPSRSQLEWYCAFFPGRLGGIPLELRGQGLQRSSVPAGSCSWPPLPPPPAAGVLQFNRCPQTTLGLE